MSALNHFDPSKTAVIDKRFSSIFDTQNISADSTASVKLTSYNPEELRYAVSSQKGGVVVFSEIYYPHGWKATVDGIETPIVRTDYVLRAIYVPAGNHEVIMSFEPTSIQVTETIAWCGFGIFALVILWSLFIAYRKKKTPSK